MAKADDKPTPAGFWMSLREAVERAGSFEALLPHLQAGRIVARADHFRYWDGAPVKIPSLDIDPDWWSHVLSVNQALGRVEFEMDIDIMAIGVELERAAVEALLPGAPDEHEKMGGLPPANAQSAASGAKKLRSQPGPQIRRVLPVLKKLYPPDGIVPDDVRTEFVRGRVNKELASDSKNQGLGDVSRDTVSRAVKRLQGRG